MKNSKLLESSLAFAVKIITLADELRQNHEYTISDQIARSGTSIGANISEAQYAQSKADFISKLQIALKEANETAYWLKLIKLAKKIDTQAQQFVTLESDCVALKAMLVSSIKTAKQGSE
ncbi:MAG: four helix bundle protein [Clostridia bacterium]|nr:four helix bundle protein [Clostridia bacterium]